MLLGQNTKQPLNNFEPPKPLKYKQRLGMRPDSCFIKKLYCKDVDSVNPYT